MQNLGMILSGGWSLWLFSNVRAGIIPPSLACLAVNSNASLAGFGALHGDEWLARVFAGEQLMDLALSHHLCGAEDEGCTTDNINVLEMWPVLGGIRCWAAG